MNDLAIFLVSFVFLQLAYTLYFLLPYEKDIDVKDVKDICKINAKKLWIKWIVVTLIFAALTIIFNRLIFIFISGLLILKHHYVNWKKLTKYLKKHYPTLNERLYSGSDLRFIFFSKEHSDDEILQLLKYNCKTPLLMRNLSGLILIFFMIGGLFTSAKFF
jgi:hypothetical protein